MQCTLRVIPEGIPGSRCIVIMVYQYPGYCATVLQKSHKFRAGIKMLYPYPWFLWHGRTELTEVPGTDMSVVQNLEVPDTDMNVLQNLQNFRVRVRKCCRTHTSSGQV